MKLSADNRILTISAIIKDSLHASIFADRLNSLPYLKVFDRIYKDGRAVIKAHTIKGLFDFEILTTDMDSMSDLIIAKDEK